MMLREASGKKRTGVVFWGLFSLLFGSVLWLLREPWLALAVAGAVFGAGVFVSGQERAESAGKEREKSWDEMIKRLLSGEQELRVRAFLSEVEPMISYREYLDPGRVLQKNGRAVWPIGLSEAFCSYVILRRLSSCDLRMIDVMLEREAQRLQRLWWQEWKKSWWAEVPLFLRKALADRFEKK